MNNLNHEEDPRLRKLHEFEHSYEKFSKGDKSLLKGHNIYLLWTEDRDGNVTGEAFALNVTTNDYFKNQFGRNMSSGSSGNKNQMSYIYIGDGDYAVDEDVSCSDTAMRRMTYSSSGTVTNNDETYVSSSTIYWDATNHVQYSDSFIMSSYFDYVLSGISTDLSITEIGLKANYSGAPISTHALVYDSNGQRTTFVKHVNEKLFINVYVRVYYKPGYIENKMFNDKVEFAYNLWSFYGFANPGSYWSGHYNGQPGKLYGGFISSPRYRRSTNSVFDIASTGVLNTWDRNMYQSGATYDSEKQIISNNVGWSGESVLIEAANRYIDKAIISADIANDVDNRLYYSEFFAMVKEIHLPNGATEEVATNWAFPRTIDNSDMTTCFGTYENSSTDVRGLLPVTNLNVTAIKSYNGLTKAWDIVENVTNGTNTYNLSMMYLFTWVGMHMYCPYLDGDTVKRGRQFVRVYCNVYTEFPITYINQTYQIWCSDTFWDIDTWERITDPANITGSLGTKRYYMAFGGSVGDASYAPWNIRRSGYTYPYLTDMMSVSRVDDIDVIDNSYTVTNKNYFPGVIGDRHFLTNDDLGYIYMNEWVWYPEADNGNGVKFKITTSEPRITTPNTPSHTLRFSEPSGRRILQFFRSTGTTAWENVSFSKLSVFSMPSQTEIDADPTVEPTETIINTTMTDNQDWNTKVTSTDTGYVVIGHYSQNRIHIVNLLGDAGSSYQPKEYILKYPGTDTEIETYMAFAIKYTSKMVFLNPNTTTDEYRGFMVIDLATNTVVDEFQIEKSYWSSLRWITGVSDVLFLTGNQYSDQTQAWRAYIYDLRKPSGSRLVDPLYSNTISRGLMPGGSQTQFSDWGYVSDTSFALPHTYGDETCILTEYVANDSSNGVGELCYIDLDNYMTPINMLSGVGLNSSRYLCGYQDYYHKRIHMDVHTFNQGKQRIIMINSACFYWYNGNGSTQSYYTFALDANRLRDTKSPPGRMNCVNTVIPNISTDWTNTSSNHAFSCGLRTSCMFRGKILLSEYNPSYTGSDGKYRKSLGDRHRWVDPNALIPHRLEGTTTTLQTWNNPKRIYGFNGMNWKLINDPSIWNPADLPSEEP